MGVFINILNLNQFPININLVHLRVCKSLDKLFTLIPLKANKKQEKEKTFLRMKGFLNIKLYKQ
jgi:hypothetical protein